MVWSDDQSAIPIARLHRNLVAERAHELVDRRGRKAAKLDRRTVAADRLDPHRLFVGIDAGHAVEIGQSLMVIVMVAFPLDRLTGWYSTNLNGPEPRMFFSYQRGSLSRISFL